MSSGHANLYRIAATGAGTIDRLTNSTFEQEPLDWSGDGRFLLYTQVTRSYGDHDTAGEQRAAAELPGPCARSCQTPVQSASATLDRIRFDDSGRREVYVQAFEPGKPASSARWQISNAGGMMPRWRGDGKEIFYLSLDGKMMAVRVSGDGAAFQVVDYPAVPVQCHAARNCGRRISNTTFRRMASAS